MHNVFRGILLDIMYKRNRIMILLNVQDLAWVQSSYVLMVESCADSHSGYHQDDSHWL